ncbi:hypothetical protein M8494_19025 [Serratia ureilytica]
MTRDKKLSAQWEHTVAVTADGVETSDAARREGAGRLRRALLNPQAISSAS